METPTILQGNTFTLAIPLRVYIIDEGGVVLEDYTPDEGDEVVITLKGPRRFYTYTPRIDGNVARIDLGGYELCGLYSVAVAITKDDGQKLRTYRGAQLSIVESIDAVTDSELEQGIEQGVLYLDAATFLSGADGRGIESVVKTATAGLVDTYTITYTDGTTSTFDVTNGHDGEDGQPGAPGTPGEDGVGILSIAKTGTVGLVDIYTIALTNGNTTTFEVTNGKDGTTPDMSNYYDKGETNALLGGKISTGSLKTINNESLEGHGNLALATREALDNFCPIIEDTRSSAVANITGIAPFSQLVNGQRIIMFFAYNNVRDATIELTLSGGATTGEIPIYVQTYNDVARPLTSWLRGGWFYEFVYRASSSRWLMVGFRDTNTTYTTITQAQIDEGTGTGGVLVTPKLLCDNFAKVTTLVEVSTTGDVSQALDSGKFYRFGTVDSLALTFNSPQAGMGSYGGKFTASASWTALGIPATIDEAAGNDSISAGKRYEFQSFDNVIVIKEI